MALFFLASLAGLFPGLTLPLVAGWKAVHVFDLLFPACLAFAATHRAIRAPDWRLIAAGAAVIAAGGLALWAHPSEPGTRAVASLAYSVVVLLAVAHVRRDALGIRIERVILGPLFLAVGIAGIVFLLENLAGVSMSRNRSPMLPDGLHRLGGFTGGNTLILFLALAAPLARAPWPRLLGIVLPAFAALSRALLGVGVALIVSERASSAPPDRLRQILRIASWSALVVSLVFYLFAVIPVVPSERAPARFSLEPGGYLTPHLAALRMFQSEPLVGVGPARFVPEFPSFTSAAERGRLPLRTRRRCEPHSAVLGMAAEQGLIGLAGLGWLFFEIFSRLRHIEDPHLRVASRAGFLGLLVGGHFVDWLALKGLWFWIGLMIASRSSTECPRPQTPS